MKTSSLAINLNSGFTLLELMIALAVLAVMASFAVPNVSKLVEGQKASAAASEYMSGLYLAKNEALKRRSNVSVCPIKKNAQLTCSGTGGTATSVQECSNKIEDWVNGYVMFVDEKGGEPDGVVDCSDEVLKVVTMNSDFVTTGTKSWFSFNSEGRGGAGFVRFCQDANSSSSKLLNSSLIGVPKIDQSNAGCGVPSS